MHFRLRTLVSGVLSLLLAGVAGAKQPITMRVGYFPNITHSQALVGVANGTFQKELGKQVDLKTVIFNAGPSAIEAMFAGSIDLAYIGPNPAINGYIRSNGKALRIIAGATSGGASLVVRDDSKISNAKDMGGKRIASPQLGNTQDVALRSYLVSHGLKPKERGGSVEITPVANPDQLTLFRKKEIDGAWAPEPWATRLVKEAGGRILLDERDLWPDKQFISACVVVSTTFLKEHPDLVKKWLKAHVLITEEINRNKDAAIEVINSELKRLTGKALPDDTIKAAFKRLDVTYQPLCSSLHQSAKNAFDAGFLGTKLPELKTIYDLKPLNSVLRTLGKSIVK